MKKGFTITKDAILPLTLESTEVTGNVTMSYAEFPELYSFVLGKYRPQFEDGFTTETGELDKEKLDQALAEFHAQDASPQPHRVKEMQAFMKAVVEAYKQRLDGR